MIEMKYFTTIIAEELGYIIITLIIRIIIMQVISSSCVVNKILTTRFKLKTSKSKKKTSVFIMLNKEKLTTNEV